MFLGESEAVAQSHLTGNDGFNYKAETLWDMDQAAWQSMEDGMREATLAWMSANLSASNTILFLNPEIPEPGYNYRKGPQAWSALVYDYSAGAATMLRLDTGGQVLAAAPFEEPIFPGAEELERAKAAVAADPVYGRIVSEGRAVMYEAMPPIDFTPGVPRTLHIGLMPTDGSFDHEIVGVMMKSGQVISFEGGAPGQARAIAGSCGPPSGGGCSTNSGGTGVVHITWPATGEVVWEFDAVRPSRTDTSATPNGAGIELRNVYYRGELILLQANVPVLNVQYDGNTCGPFRDWLSDESCIDVTGGAAVVGEPGFYRGTSVPATICVDGTDAGNFRGVGIQDNADSIYLISEMSAGWYRYLVGWVMHVDGSITAKFDYAGTFNSCTCDNRTHHAYWRLDWALGGVPDAGTPGGFAADNVFEKRTAVGQPWTGVTTETSMFRTLGQNVGEFRVRNPTTGVSYEFLPNKFDATAQGDSFGVSDVWLLKWKQGSQTNDTGGAAINLSSYTNGETVSNERLVVWYGGHLRQDTSGGGGGGNTCVTFGPVLKRSVPTPTVAAIALKGVTPTNASNVTFDVLFSGSVMGVDATDFVLDVGGDITGASIASVTGGSDSWSVNVATGSGDGTVSIDLIDDDTIVGESGIPLGGEGADNGAFSEGSTYTIDRTAPEAAVLLTGNNPTNANSLPFGIIFDESVGTSFGPADVTVTGSLAGLANVSISGTNPSFTVNVQPIDQNADGTVGITVGTAVFDLAGNAFAGIASPGSYTLDNVAPVSTISTSNEALTNVDSLEFDLSFAESLGATLSTSQIVLGGSLAGATEKELVTRGGDAYTLTLTPTDPDADGTLSFSFAASVTDAAGNPPTGDTSSGTFTFDNTGPDAVIDIMQSTPTTEHVLTFTVSFSESIAGTFDASDVMLGGTLAAGATVDVTGADPSFTVTVTLADTEAEGTLTMSVGTAVTDVLGNPFGGGTSINVYVVDHTAPEAAIELPGANPTDANSVDFTIAFDESVGESFTADDVTLTGSLAGAASIAITGSDASFTVTVTMNDPNADGTIGIEVGTDVTDLAGNGFGGATSPSEYTIRHTVPSGIVVGFSLPGGGSR